MSKETQTSTGAKEFNPGPVELTTLILSFASAALYYLGLAPLEGKSKPEKNIVLAKQNIDILTLLKEKTKGNLTADEAKLIEQVVGDLQMKYLEASKPS